jgi:glycosyltransferase involved in cell wall biosynthesis
MKILLVNRLMGIFWGGGESFDYNLAKTLKKMGNEVFILTGKPLFSMPKNKIDLEVFYLTTPYLRGISYKLGNKIPKIPNAIAQLDLIIFEKEAFKWIKKNKDKFDVIQILSLPRLAEKIVDVLGKPIVLWLPGPPAKKWDIPVIKRLKDNPLVEIFAHGDTIRYLKEKGIEINHIPPGVNCNSFTKGPSNIRWKYNIKDDEVVLISVGRLISGKGFEFLIDGFNEVIKEVQNLKLIIVGDGVLKSKLEKKVAEFRIQDKVIFAGKINHRELPKYYSAADIFLLLSSYENFSNVILEAKACELPIIATNVGGFPLQIKDGINGFLVNYGDLRSLKEKIIYLAKNSNIREKMGKLNRQEVLEKYSWEETAIKVMSLYEKVKNNKKKKILFLIPNLSGGGAERVMSNLLNYFSSEFKVITVFFNNNHVYPLTNDCKVYYLDNDLPRIGFIKKLMRIIYLRNVIKKEKPDVALSFLTNLYLITSAIFPRRLNVKLIISERNTISYILKFSKNKMIKRILFKTLYKKVDNIIAVSKGVKEDLMKTFNLPQEKIRVIYNPHDIDKIQELSKEQINHPWLVDKKYPVIINVGRLTYQKGQDILLKAFKIVNERIESRLIILGEGPLLNKLKGLGKELGIENKVDFVGFQKNPFAFISRSDVFVLSSRWEGFPNVLIEAMACGVPVISTDCPSGTNEIIEDGVNGLLVPIEVDKLAESIIWILTNIEFSKRIARMGQESVRKYDKFKIFEDYLKVIKE